MVQEISRHKQIDKQTDKETAKSLSIKKLEITSFGQKSGRE